MHIVYKITMISRKQRNEPPYYYIGSKSNCVFKDGKMYHSNGTDIYYGSSSWEDWSTLCLKEEVKTEILFESNNYEEVLKKEKEIQIMYDVVASKFFFNKSIAAQSNYTNPEYATYKHTETGKTVRLKRDHPKVLSGEYRGVTYGRSVKNDPGHQNRGSSSSKNGFFGKSHPPEIIESNKKKHQEWLQSEEGIKFRKRAAEKAKETFKGKPKSPDQKRKIGRKGMVMMRNLNTGEVIRIHKDNLHQIDRNWVSMKKGVKNPLATCKYCGFEATNSNISRWHNEKCKHKGK